MIHGRGITIDVSEKNVMIEEIEKSVSTLFLGGNGIGAYMLYQKMKATDALSPESWIIFAPGVLNGSTFPMTSKCGFFGLSPLTGAFGESYFGSSLGVSLKSKEYDFIAITGKSDTLCYILVDDDVSIVECEDLRNETTSSCEYILKRRHNGSCACIGPAGENLVKFAAIVGDGRQAGRTGLGAVLGSKSVKSIVVVPDIIELNRKKIKKIRKKCVKGFLEGDGYPAYQGYHSLGTGKSILPFSEKWGVLPTKNFEKSQFDKASKIDTTAWIDRVTRNTGCHGCMIACGKMFKGVSDPEFETLYALGSNLLCDDIEVIAEANRLCDEYGMDTISMGGVLGYMMSLSEEKVKDIKFGDSTTIMSLIEKTAFREGIGNDLAEGVTRLSTIQGNTYEAVQVLGLEPPAYDVRGLKGMALSFITSPRGACHLRSSAYIVELSGEWKHLKTDRLSSDGKGYVAWMENLMTLHDIMGTCKFTRDFYMPEMMSEMLSAYTDIHKTPEELIEIGERTFNLEWLFNMRNGIKIGKLPPKFRKPVKEGPSKGSFISEEDEKKMKEEYFEARGWNKNGIPTKETLNRLKLT